MSYPYCDSLPQNPIIFDDIDFISRHNGSLYDCGYIPGVPGDSDVEFVTFSGGGMAGAAFAGVLQDMESRGIYCPKKGILTTGGTWSFEDCNTPGPVKYWIGSSAGAICSSLAALGAPSQYLIDQILNTDARMFLDYGGRKQTNPNSRAPWTWWQKILNYKYGISELFSHWGIARGTKFHDWFVYQMRSLGWDPNTTFADLYDTTGQYLSITATSLNTHETLYLSRSSFPYMKICDAVDVSMRLPFIFQPVYMNDPNIVQGRRILTDGGVLNNLPINACDVTSSTGEVLAINRKAVGFTLISEGKWTPDYVTIDGLLKYSVTFIKSMHTYMHALQSNQPYFWDRVVPIETHGIGTIDFDLDKSKLQTIIREGRESSRKFFDHRKQMLKVYGPLPRNLFIPNCRLRYKGVEHISDDLIENTMIYQTNPSHFRWNRLPSERCFSC